MVYIDRHLPFLLLLFSSVEIPPLEHEAVTPPPGMNLSEMNNFVTYSVIMYN